MKFFLAGLVLSLCASIFLIPVLEFAAPVIRLCFPFYVELYAVIAWLLGACLLYSLRFFSETPSTVSNRLVLGWVVGIFAAIVIGILSILAHGLR